MKQILAVTTLALVLPACGSAADDYKGTYSCNYTGSDTGTLTAKLSTASDLIPVESCSARSTVTGSALPCNGSITSLGAVTFFIGSATATGQADHLGAKGAWTGPNGSGSFTCSR